MHRFAIFAVVGLVACASPTAPTPEAPIGQEFTMRPRTTLYIEGTSTAFSFQQVVSDSRCPLDALCIQPGEAVVGFGVGSESSAFVGRLSTRATQPFSWGIYQLRLVRLEPYPRTTLTIGPDDYRATFLITTQ